LLGPRTRLVAIAHVSNALGTILPVQQMIAMARRYPARVLVDGAQAVPHFASTCRRWTRTFTSSLGTRSSARRHRALYGKLALLEICRVAGRRRHDRKRSVRGDDVQQGAVQFEAEPPTLQAPWAGAAIDYLDRINFEAAAAYEEALTQYATQRLAMCPACDRSAHPRARWVCCHL